jgi:hypothetical protein
MSNQTGAAWIAVILAAVVITSAANIAVWLHHTDGPVRLVSNAATVLALPVWIPLRPFNLAPSSIGPVGIVLVNALAATL